MASAASTLRGSRLTRPPVAARPERVAVREQIAGIQRSRMLSAIAEVAAERGAANVSVAHVTERSGTSRRTFYELFADREACYVEAFDELAHRAERIVVEAYAGDGQWAAKIRAAIVALLELFDRERDTAWLLVVDSLGAGAKVLERRQALVGRTVEALYRDGVQDPPASVIAEGVVGAVSSVLHARLVEGADGPLAELVNSLTSIVVLPYLGAAAARKELNRAAPKRRGAPVLQQADPLLDIGGRLTYRTVRTLSAVAAAPGSSNREIGLAAGMGDQGQTSKLLTRLERLGLICNARDSQSRGRPNVWMLTSRGRAIEQAMSANMAAAG
jgi:AcrR family transcriptional regulator